MSAGPQARLLPDGKRLHLHHGPIDLICGVEGADRDACFAQAQSRFRTILAELVPELPLLRRQVGSQRPGSPVGRRMHAASLPHRARFVTLMAGVAGAVADEILAAMCGGHSPERAYVNNGGDVAFAVPHGAAFTALGPAGEITLRTCGGVATSGWSGRSFSLGIADAVTVVARSAAQADVAATLIANAVDLPGHPVITRTPAHDLSPDSDLGARLVTTGVGPLHSDEVRAALRSGQQVAAQMRRENLIMQAALSLNGRVALVETEELLNA